MPSVVVAADTRRFRDRPEPAGGAQRGQPRADRRARRRHRRSRRGSHGPRGAAARRRDAFLRRRRHHDVRRADRIAAGRAAQGALPDRRRSAPAADPVAAYAETGRRRGARRRRRRRAQPRCSPPIWRSPPRTRSSPRATSISAPAPTAGMTATLARVVGLKQAAELMLLGDRFDARRALGARARQPRRPGGRARRRSRWRWRRGSRPDRPTPMGGPRRCLQATLGDAFDAQLRRETESFAAMRRDRGFRRGCPCLSRKAPAESSPGDEVP